MVLQHLGGDTEPSLNSYAHCRARDQDVLAMANDGLVLRGAVSRRDRSVPRASAQGGSWHAGLRAGVAFLYVTFACVLSVGLWAKPLIANATVSFKKAEVQTTG